MAKVNGSVVTKQGEGSPLWFLGSLYEVKATGESTGGVLSAIEMTIPPGQASAPPPHRHSGAEAVYVVDGNVRFHIEDRTVEAGPGAFVFFPKGTKEWPEVTGSKPAKVLIIYTPGGLDRFFQEVGEPAKSRGLPPGPVSQPDFAKISSVGRKYGLEVEPPPGH